MQAERIGCLKVNYPELFEHPTFITWLNDPKGATTWHQKGTEAGDYSDVFITYDHGDSGDSEYLEGEVWEKICDVADQNGLSYGIIWITNLDD